MRELLVGDPREVPPSASTVPLVSKQKIRRHREDADLYAYHRKRGTHPYTLDEIDARIVACAADLAAAKGEGPAGPPILRELIAIFWHRLYRDIPLSPEQRASFQLEARRANTSANVARENLTRAERRRRNLESEAKRTRPPVTGTILTQPWVILFCLIPGAVIEVLGSMPSLRIAFDISTTKATVFAVAISAILILAADQLGNALAAAVNGSRRRAALAAGLLLAVAIVAGGWAVSDLAASRTTNLARQQQLEAIESAGGESGGFGGFEELTGPANAAERKQKEEKEAREVAVNGGKRQAAIEELPDPSFTFFIPLSFLIMSTATLVAFRIETAREWNERAQGLEDAQRAAQENRKREADARQAANDAGLPEDQVFQEAAAYVEREHGILAGWIERFRAEYQRFCAVEKCRPRSIVVPRLPEPEEALFRLLYPRGGPEDGSVRSSRPAASGEDPGGDQPEDDEPQFRSGPGPGPGSAPGGGSAPRGEPESGPGTGPRREPPPQAPRPRPRRPRRRGDDGRPKGWGSSGSSSS